MASGTSAASLLECSGPVDNGRNRSRVLVAVAGGSSERGNHQETLPVGGHSVTAGDWNRLLLCECGLKERCRLADLESVITAYLNGHESSIWSEIVQLPAIAPPNGLGPTLCRDRPLSHRWIRETLNDDLICT